MSSFARRGVESLAPACGWFGPPFRCDEERRLVLRCELDAAFFHLYMPAENNGDWNPAEGETGGDLERLKASFPTPSAAVAYIMDTFPIVHRKDQEDGGDYRTRRVILENYDAIQEPIRTGQPYQTRLDPPPADPSCCHHSYLSLLVPAQAERVVIAFCFGRSVQRAEARNLRMRRLWTGI